MGGIRITALGGAGNASEVSRLIMAVRHELNLSQRDLGRQLGGVHRDTISAWEHGVTEPPVHLLPALRLMLAQGTDPDGLSEKAKEQARGALLRIELDAAAGLLSEEHRRWMLEQLSRTVLALQAQATQRREAA